MADKPNDCSSFITFDVDADWSLWGQTRKLNQQFICEAIKC